MALSTYCKFGAFEDLSSQMSSSFQVEPREAELSGDLLCYSNDFDLSNNLFQPLHDPSSFQLQEDYSHLLPYFSSHCDPIISLSEILTPQDIDPYSYPKRQKCYENEYFSDINPSFFDGCFTSFSPVPEIFPHVFPPLSDYRIPGADFTQLVECLKNTNERCASAQSIAARERRRKITEKTQELSKLIPGGTKMNTAEMLQAASKYVKYLQAQVGILELMASFQKPVDVAPRKELQVILGCPSVQEKLYVEDKCLVTKEFVIMLATHYDLQTEPSISHDLHRLVRCET